MPGRYIKKRKQTWFANIPIPPRYRHLHGGRSKIEVSLKTRDERIAERTARSMAAHLQLEWAAKVDGCKQSEAALRLTTYEQAREAALTGRIVADVREGLAPVDPDRVYEAVELITDEVRDAALHRTDPDENPEGDVELTPLEQARLDGLWDGVRELRGETPDSRAAYEPSFRDVAGKWMDEWKARPGRKDANTSRQYESTIRMFSQWWGEKTLRRIKATDAARYVSYLRGIDPGTARNGGRARQVAPEVPAGGLKDATINRHVGTLKAIWKWSKQRGYADGDNPWEGLSVRLTSRNQHKYVPWTLGELRKLLIENPPARRELYELCFVALYTGLRISEAADMTWGQVREEGGVPYVSVVDAKTEAGNREVPLHRELAWLLKKTRGKADEPIWPEFNPEGPSKSRGDDASRMFGSHKRRLGFTSRQKVFHSFRKNITAEMEHLEIAPNIWARIIGHEPGFTFGTYNPIGLTLAKKAEVIGRLSYAGLNLPPPAELYGERAAAPKVRNRRRASLR